MHKAKEQLSRNQEIFFSFGLLATTLFAGIPLMDIGNTSNAIRAVLGVRNSCEFQQKNINPKTLVLLSAGWDDRNSNQINQHEKWRIEALVYEYLKLAETGNPPELIVLAVKDGTMNEYKIRNAIQKEYSKLTQGMELSNELFEIVYANHTDSSILAAKEVLEEYNIKGSTVFVTSDPHYNRARFNVCRRLGSSATVINAEDLINSHDQHRYIQMQRAKLTSSYTRSTYLEDLKTISWIWRPRQFYPH